VRTTRTLPRISPLARWMRCWLRCVGSGIGRLCWVGCGCEVLGLRLEDLHVGQRRVFIGEGKSGHQRIVPVSARFFTAAAAYLEAERPAGIATNRLSVALKGRCRGESLSAFGVDEILSGATRRAGLAHASCHELGHTCLTRLQETPMALEAVQAQAGHASIESTRIYLHLADDWLAGQARWFDRQSGGVDGPALGVLTAHISPLEGRSGGASRAPTMPIFWLGRSASESPTA